MTLVVVFVVLNTKKNYDHTVMTVSKSLKNSDKNLSLIPEKSMKNLHFSKNSNFEFKVKYDEKHSTPESCLRKNCEDNHAMIKLLPEEHKLFKNVDVFTKEYTVLNKTQINISDSRIEITVYSDKNKKNHGGDYFNSYVTDGSQALVAHEIIDHANGTYSLKQKCRVDSDKNFSLFILAERSAEQIQFYRTILRANKQLVMNWYVDGTECSILPYAPNLVKVKVDENFIYCEKDIQPDGKKSRSEYDNSKHLHPMMGQKFSSIYHMVFQKAVFLCSDGKTVEIYPSRKSCSFTDVKLNTDKSLPLCDYENSGLNINGHVNIEPNTLIEKLKNKQVFWLYGDSTSRNLVKSSVNILKMPTKPSGWPLKSFKCAQRGAERWTFPEKYASNYSTLYRVPHPGPPMSNPICNAGSSVKRILTGIDDLIASKPNDSIIVFAPGFHYTNWNPYIFARDVSNINKHSIDLKKKYPNIKILFREVPWSCIIPESSRFLSTWIQ